MTAALDRYQELLAHEPVRDPGDYFTNAYLPGN